MSTNSYEGFYGAKLVNRFALHSIKDDPFSHNISKTFGTNVMFFIQADFLVTFKQRCFKEDIIACEHGIEIQKPFVEVYYSDFSMKNPTRNPTGLSADGIVGLYHRMTKTTMYRRYKHEKDERI